MEGGNLESYQAKSRNNQPCNSHPGDATTRPTPPAGRARLSNLSTHASYTDPPLRGTHGNRPVRIQGFSRWEAAACRGCRGDANFLFRPGQRRRSDKRGFRVHEGGDSVRCRLYHKERCRNQDFRVLSLASRFFTPLKPLVFVRDRRERQDVSLRYNLSPSHRLGCWRSRGKH